jgi:hypothetical protein
MHDWTFGHMTGDIMPTNELLNRTFDARPDRFDFRDLPYRPRLVNLPDQYPSLDLIDNYFPLYRAANLVRDQGQWGACTGFGLAAVVNYLRWEEPLRNGADVTELPVSPESVSPRMLYQNARLYDEWKGEDYEGSSCRGAMKGFQKHGVCVERLWPYAERNGKPGTAKPGWDANAPLTPLGAYFRIDGKSLLDMQSAIFETHAIYVSAEVHDGWKKVKDRCTSLEGAVIQPPKSKDTGGHAFAIVGYTGDGFIIQNSWGSDWGYAGFALLPYEDWIQHGTDAWVLALGAPMRVTMAFASLQTGRKNEGAAAPPMFLSPSAKTDLSLGERLRQHGNMAANVAEDTSKVSPWIGGEEFGHLIFIGHNGRAERELVAANDGNHAVQLVIEKGLKSAAEKGYAHVAIYDHGGLNDRAAGVKRAQILGPWFEANGIYPIFVIWQTGFFESAKDIIETATEKLFMPAEAAEGWLLEKLNRMKDRAFEVFARDAGVKAIWENMKGRAAGAVAADGGLTVAAKFMRKALAGQNKPPKLHLLGHSAGAIMQGHFLSAMKSNRLSASSIHLWAPACNVDFATDTYGAAFANGVANPKTMFIDVLSDANERDDPCVPGLYSKSLLYLVSRALEAEHKTPILGMARVWPKWDKNDDTFMSGYEKQLKLWRDASKNVQLDRPIVKPEVPTLREPNKLETIDASHGSFDNNIEVVNRAIERITGKKPKVPVTDLRGF